MTFTDEQMHAPTAIRKALETLRDEYLVNNPGGQGLIADAMGALKHLELAFVKMVLQASPQVTLPVPSIGIDQPTQTSSTAAKVVVTVKGEPAFTQVDTVPAKKPVVPVPAVPKPVVKLTPVVTPPVKKPVVNKPLTKKTKETKFKKLNTRRKKK